MTPPPPQYYTFARRMALAKAFPEHFTYEPPEAAAAVSGGDFGGEVWGHLGVPWVSPHPLGVPLVSLGVPMSPLVSPHPLGVPWVPPLGALRNSLGCPHFPLVSSGCPHILWVSPFVFLGVPISLGCPLGVP